MPAAADWAQPARAPGTRDAAGNSENTETITRFDSSRAILGPQALMLPEAVRMLYLLLSMGRRVYVHCTAGINRATLTVVGYLTFVQATVSVAVGPGCPSTSECVIRGRRLQLPIPGTVPCITEQLHRRQQAACLTLPVCKLLTADC